MRNITLTLPLLMAAGCAMGPSSPMQMQIQAREAARLEATLVGFTPGAPTRCVPNRDLRGPEAYGDKTLLFRSGRNLIYRNDAQGSCKGVGRGEALITRQFSSEMCEGDIARTADLQTGFQSSACALGPFIPYRRR